MAGAKSQSDGMLRLHAALVSVAECPTNSGVKTLLMGLLLTLATGAGADDFVARIEIPAGSNVKYEINDATGEVVVDRFLSTAMAYPANYGTLRGTLAGDGDALDVLVLTRAPIVPGATIRVRPVGVLPMRDGGEEDDKILAVPVESVDATYREIRDITDVPAAERERIAEFFRVYKNLPRNGKTVEVGEWRDATAARAVLRAAVAAASAARDAAAAAKSR